MVKNNFSFTSYNCRGLRADKYPFVNKLLKNTDFLLFQKHWLRTSDLSTFNSFSPTSSNHGCSDMSDSEILTDRPLVASAYYGTMNLII